MNEKIDLTLDSLFLRDTNKWRRLDIHRNYEERFVSDGNERILGIKPEDSRFFIIPPEFASWGRKRKPHVPVLDGGEHPIDTFEKYSAAQYHIFGEHTEASRLLAHYYGGDGSECDCCGRDFSVLRPRIFGICSECNDSLETNSRNKFEL